MDDIEREIAEAEDEYRRTFILDEEDEDAPSYDEADARRWAHEDWVTSLETYNPDDT